jgi:glycosyltransferase involved in cell wall biosynthesis
MHILHIYKDYYPELGGIENNIRILAEALAHTIEQALTNRDLRTALQQRGLARAAHFSWEQAAQTTLNVYHSLLEHAA